VCYAEQRPPRKIWGFSPFRVPQDFKGLYRRLAALYDTKTKRVKHTGPIYRMVQMGTVLIGRVKEVAAQGKRPVVFSYGAGLDSFWSLVMLFSSNDPYWVDLRERVVLIVHAALGAEFEETDAHLHNVAIPFLRRQGWEMTIVKPRVTARDGNVYEGIWEYYMAQGAVPTRAKRSCTPRWKIGPLLAACKDLLGTDDYETIINYDASETHRTERLKEVPEAERERIRDRLHHPPMVMGKYRLDMAEELLAMNLEVPRKSACFFCIFQKVAEIEWMALNKPHFMAKTIALEENMQRVRRYSRRAKGKGDITILSKPMRFYQERALSKRAAEEAQGRLFEPSNTPPDMLMLSRRKKAKTVKQIVTAEQTKLAV